MSVINNIKKYYKGNLTPLINSKKIYKFYGKTYNEEQYKLKNRETEYDDISDEEYKNESYAACDRIGFFKNILAFAEITSYKGKYLRDMTMTEKSEAIDGIINDLHYIYENPIGYEVLEDIVIVCFIVTNICDTSSIDMLIDMEYSNKAERN